MCAHPLSTHRGIANQGPKAVVRNYALFMPTCSLVGKEGGSGLQKIAEDCAHCAKHRPIPANFRSTATTRTLGGSVGLLELPFVPLRNNRKSSSRSIGFCFEERREKTVCKFCPTFSQSVNLSPAKVMQVIAHLYAMSCSFMTSSTFSA